MTDEIILSDAQDVEEMDILESMVFKLSKPITYAHPQEGQKTADTILMNEPTFKSYKFAEAMKEKFVAASTEQTERSLSYRKQMEEHRAEKQKDKVEEKEDLEMKPHEVISVLESSSKVQTMEVAQIFCKLLKSDNLFLLDGQQPMTDEIINKISFSDFNRMMGRYYLSFLVKSLLG